MVRNRIVRRVAKRTYDRYSITDYSTFTDNLNPVNPTVLETQFTSMVQSVKARVISAYARANVEVPEELYSPDVSPTTLLNDVDNLINKLKKNPLQDLLGDLDSIDAVAPFASTLDKATDIMDNPLKLDCSGIELTLDNSYTAPAVSASNEADDDESNTTVDENGNTWNNAENANAEANSSDSFSTDSDSSTVVHITYKGLSENEDMSKYPSILLKKECPMTLQTPTVIPANYMFSGWYYDSAYNTPVSGNILNWPGKDITVYALIDVALMDSEESGSQYNDGLDALDSSSEDDCDLIELAFLKIILIVIIIIKVLISVLVLVLNIMKAAADIAKDAQLCWINPPSLQSLIAYVTQRLAAVIFQIVGLILLKLWSLLNFDCVTDNTINTMEQINQALAGIIDMFGRIEALSLNFDKEKNNSYWDTIKDTITSLKDQIAQQAKDVWDGVGSLGDQLKAAGQDIADTYTNPATYLAAVPPEIKNKVLSTVDQYTTTMENVKTLQASMSRLKNKKSKTQNPTPKGMDIISF